MPHSQFALSFIVYIPNKCRAIILSGWIDRGGLSDLAQVIVKSIICNYWNGIY